MKVCLRALLKKSAKMQYILTTLYSSVLVKDENECEVRKARKTNFLSASVAVVAGITSIVTFVNQLTPTFTRLIDFRARDVLSLAFLASVLGLSFYIALSRHLCKSTFIDQNIKHFNYSWPRRIVALCSSLVAIAAIVIALSDLKYWFGFDGPIQGRVVDVRGRPVAGAIIDAVNRDDKSVCQSASRTVSNGGFVLDFERAMGRAAYFTVNGTKCGLKQPTPASMNTFVNKKGSQNEGSLLLHLSCAVD